MKIVDKSAHNLNQTAFRQVWQSCNNRDVPHGASNAADLREQNNYYHEHAEAVTECLTSLNNLANEIISKDTGYLYGRLWQAVTGETFVCGTTNPSSNPDTHKQVMRLLANLTEQNLRVNNFAAGDTVAIDASTNQLTITRTNGATETYTLSCQIQSSTAGSPGGNTTTVLDGQGNTNLDSAPSATSQTLTLGNNTVTIHMEDGDHIITRVDGGTFKYYSDNNISGYQITVGSETYTVNFSDGQWKVYDGQPIINNQPTGGDENNANTNRGEQPNTHHAKPENPATKPTPTLPEVPANMTTDQAVAVVGELVTYLESLDKNVEIDVITAALDKVKACCDQVGTLKSANTTQAAEVKKLDEANAKLKEQIKTLKATIQEQEKTIAEQKNALETAQAKAKKSNDEKTKVQTETEKSLNEEIKKLEDELVNAASNSDEAKKLTDEVATMKQKLASAKADISKYFTEEIAELQKKQAELEKLLKECSEISKKINSSTSSSLSDALPKPNNETAIKKKAEEIIKKPSDNHKKTGEALKQAFPDAEVSFVLPNGTTSKNKVPNSFKNPKKYKLEYRHVHVDTDKDGKKTNHIIIDIEPILQPGDKGYERFRKDWSQRIIDLAKEVRDNGANMTYTELVYQQSLLDEIIADQAMYKNENTDQYKTDADTIQNIQKKLNELEGKIPEGQRKLTIDHETKPKKERKRAKRKKEKTEKTSTLSEAEIKKITRKIAGQKIVYNLVQIELHDDTDKDQAIKSVREKLRTDFAADASKVSQIQTSGELNTAELKLINEMISATIDGYTTPTEVTQKSIFTALAQALDVDTKQDKYKEALARKVYKTIAEEEKKLKKNK